MASILVWGGDGGGAGETRVLALGPALLCTAAYILQSGQRAAADQQGTANRQVADVGRFLILPLSGSLSLSGPPH